MLRLIPLFTVALLLGACGDDKPEPKPTGKHIWSDQVESLKTGKDAARDLQESMKRQQQRIEDARR